jgi:Mrp family chromosome partitioning ATPase
VPLHKPELPDQLLPSDERIAGMIRDLADSFDLVIVDVGSVNASASLITNQAREGVFDAAMVVIDRRKSDQNSIDNSVMRIRHAGVSSIGIVENFAA